MKRVGIAIAISGLVILPIYAAEAVTASVDVRDIVHPLLTIACGKDDKSSGNATGAGFNRIVPGAQAKRTVASALIT